MQHMSIVWGLISYRINRIENMHRNQKRNKYYKRILIWTRKYSSLSYLKCIKCSQPFVQFTTQMTETLSSGWHSIPFPDECKDNKQRSACEKICISNIKLFTKQSLWWISLRFHFDHYVSKKTANMPKMITQMVTGSSSEIKFLSSCK